MRKRRATDLWGSRIRQSIVDAVYGRFCRGIIKRQFALLGKPAVAPGVAEEDDIRDWFPQYVRVHPKEFFHTPETKEA